MASEARDMQNLPPMQAPMPTADTGTVMSLIHRAASDPNIDIDKMERLLQMHERMEAKQAEQAFNVALNLVQSAIGRIAANKENKQTSSRYADYAQLDRALRPLYLAHGFSLSFTTEPCGPEAVRIVGMLSHSAGHTRRYEVEMPADGKGAKGNDVMTKTHATGSAMSYGSRYLLKLIFNIAIGQDDDDGNGAGGAPRISEEQELKLSAMIEESETDKDAFFAWLGIDRLVDLPAAAFGKAHTALKQKIKVVNQKRGGK